MKKEIEQYMDGNEGGVGFAGARRNKIMTSWGKLVTKWLDFINKIGNHVQFCFHEAQVLENAWRKHEIELF